MEDVEKDYISILNENDIVTARKTARNAAMSLGFGITDVTRIVTAASELARNIFKYAGSGIMKINSKTMNNLKVIELVFEDKGPGIPDITRALEFGFSSSGGLGMGLPGAKRLVDEMEIESVLNKGTKVTIRKWQKGIFFGNNKI